MTRGLLVWLLSVVLAVTSIVPGYVRAATTPDAPNSVEQGFDDGRDLSGFFEDFFGASAQVQRDQMIEAWISHESTLDDLRGAARAAHKTDLLGGFAGTVEKALTGGQLLWHLAKGEWSEATKFAVAAIAEYASAGLLATPIMALAIWACGIVIVGSGGMLTPVCVGGLVATAHYLRSEVVEAGVDPILDWAEARLLCRSRPRTNACDVVPQEPPEGLFTSWEPGELVPPGGADAGPFVPRPRMNQARSGAGGGASGGGQVGIGSSRITAVADDVTTIATGGASAVTDIGVLESGGGRLNVQTGDIVTIAPGRDARTTIGSGSGTVSTGPVINEGGTLEIGASGTTRDGMKCIEIYRQTCIVHYYFRRKSDPCLPRYWIDGRKCRLPADTRHKIK